jgi:hypothetical protein
MKQYFLTVATVLLMMPTLCPALTKPGATVAPPAPLPPAIAAAKTVFLSNSCNDDYKTCTNIYNELYAGLQSHARYKIVLDPAQADLVFEIHYSTKLSGVSGSSESGPISQYGSDLQLIIQDRATRIALWSISESGSRKVTAVDQVLADLMTLSTAGIQSTSAQGIPPPSTTKSRMSQEKP